MLPQGDVVVELLPGFVPLSTPEVDLEFLEEGVFEVGVFEFDVFELDVFEFDAVESPLPSFFVAPDAAAILLHSKSQPALSFPLPIPASHSSPVST